MTGHEALITVKLLAFLCDRLQDLNETTDSEIANPELIGIQYPSTDYLEGGKAALAAVQSNLAELGLQLTLQVAVGGLSEDDESYPESYEDDVNF